MKQASVLLRSELYDEPGTAYDWPENAPDGTPLNGTGPGTDYNIALNQLISWAGPWICFRADNLTLDFRSLSVREIDPY